MESRQLGSRIVQASINSHCDATFFNVRYIAIGQREMTLLIRHYNRLSDDELRFSEGEARSWLLFYERVVVAVDLLASFVLMSGPRFQYDI